MLKKLVFIIDNVWDLFENFSLSVFVNEDVCFSVCNGMFVFGFGLFEVIEE